MASNRTILILRWHYNLYSWSDNYIYRNFWSHLFSMQEWEQSMNLPRPWESWVKIFLLNSWWFKNTTGYWFKFLGFFWSAINRRIHVNSLWVLSSTDVSWNVFRLSRLHMMSLLSQSIGTALIKFYWPYFIWIRDLLLLW